MSNSKLKCRYCKNYFRREEMITTPKGSFCTDTHAAKYAIASIPKVRQKQKKEAKSKDKKRLAELRPLSHWLNEAQRDGGELVEALADALEESGRTISRLESRESEVIIDLDNEIDGLRDEVSDLESENIDLRKKIKSIHEMTEL